MLLRGVNYLLVVFLIAAFFPFSVFAQAQNPDLQKGIAEFRQENFEEALESLLKARTADPGNSMPEYYLGVTYKNMQNYKDAQKHLEAALDLSPQIKAAFLELAEVNYNLGEFDKALKVIEMAEGENINPGQTAFIKGLILRGMDNNTAAVESFDNAAQRSAELVSAADYQAGQAYLKENNLDDAEKRFKNVIEKSPDTDMAVFSRDFLAQIEEKRREQRQFRAYAGLHYQYDDNVVLKPEDNSIAITISDESDYRKVITVGLEYVPTPRRTLDYTAHYSLYANFHNDLSQYDYQRHTFVLNPSYRINEQSRADLVLRYSYHLVDDSKYLSKFAINPTFTKSLGKDSTIQAYVGYQKKNFLSDVTVEADNRDADEYSLNLNWFYFFKQEKGVLFPFMEEYDLSFFAKNKGYFNLFYKLSADRAEGTNWDLLANKVTATLLVPLLENWKLRLTGDFSYHDYQKKHSTFGVFRTDYIYDAFALLYYRFQKNLDLQFLYNHVRDDSNIALFDYSRNVYSIGIEWRY